MEMLHTDIIYDLSHREAYVQYGHQRRVEALPNDRTKCTQHKPERLYLLNNNNNTKNTSEKT